MGLESNSQNMISWISKSSGSEAVAGLGTLIFVGLFAVSPIAFILVNSFNIASPGHPFRGGLQGMGRRVWRWQDTKRRRLQFFALDPVLCRRCDCVRGFLAVGSYSHPGPRRD